MGRLMQSARRLMRLPAGPTDEEYIAMLALIVIVCFAVFTV